MSVGRLRVSAVVERAGPTRPTWLLPEALPEAVDPHRAWLAPHFLDDKGRFLRSVHSFVVRAPGETSSGRTAAWLRAWAVRAYAALGIV